MLSINQHALSQNTIEEIYNLEIVNTSKNRLEHTNNVYFEIPLSNSLKIELTSCFQIDLTGIEKIPMRWIKGDTLAHTDKQKDNSRFTKTYLLYLSDSRGSLVVDTEEYPISKNLAYTFSEGISHATKDTNDEPRLLLGPMSENIVAVGAPSTYISEPGGTTVYIQDIGGNVNYSLDQVNWQTLYWPCYITNTSIPTTFKGFQFTGFGNVKDLLAKLENYVVVSNTNNLADLKVYSAQTFDASYTNLFLETTDPDFTDRADDPQYSVSSVGTGSGTVVVNNRVADNFSVNGYVGGYGPWGINFPSVDFDSRSLDASLNVWRNSDRFHIRLYRVELFPDGTPAEVTIDMLYKFSTSEVFIKVSNLLNFSTESNSNYKFGIYSESNDINNDPGVVKIDISTLDFSIIDGQPLYYAAGISAENLITAGFTSQQLTIAGYGIIDLSGAPVADYLKVRFLSDITLYDSYNYFVCQTEKIQFGSSSLNNDGSRPVININYVYYDGLIQNGDENNGGYNNIRIYNLLVNGNGYSTQIRGGWLCKKYFGNSATNNYIINCSSNGTINGGGIVGEYAAANSGQLYIIGCSSSGQISQDEAGGIVARYAGYNNGSVNVISCWSSGIISGSKSGGIVGIDGNNVTITNCYSNGNITGTYAGGIAGLNNGNGSCTISNCYATGNILADYCGGIGGAIDPISNITLSITNCYYTGDIGNFVGSGAITGPINTSNSGNFNISIANAYASGSVYSGDGYIIGSINVENYSYSQPNRTIISSNCYSEYYGSSNNTWLSSNANTVLLGVPLSQPGLGISWFSTGLNQPYKIRNMGYSPYTINNIDNSNNLVKNIGSSIAAGSVSLGGYYFNNYSIVAITGGSSGSYNTLNIDPSSGTVSTTSGTAPGTYTIYIYSEGSYNLTLYTIVVSQAPCLIDNTMVLTPKGYINVKYLKKGDYVKTNDNRNVKIEHIFSSLIVNPTETLYPCKIEKNSIAMDYPKNDLYISQNHLINYGNSWILPRLFFPIDSSKKSFTYYHIKLENYKTDHLVIDDGVVVESLASNDEECLEYISRARTSVELYNILSKNSSNTL